MENKRIENLDTNVLPLLAKFTSITDLNTLLETVVTDLPQLVGALGCWIYLEPEYVSEHRSFVIRNNEKIDAEILENDFVVLASTNQTSKKQNIGNAYFETGEGIVGWVYKYGRMLNIADISDSRHLKTISTDLYWANLYNDSEGFYKLTDPIPLLIVPLVIETETIGIIKFHAAVTGISFSEVSEQIAWVVAQTISGVIRQTWMVNEQSRALSEIIDISSKQDAGEVILGVTSSLKKMFNASKVQFFLTNKKRDCASLIIQNGQMIPKNQSVSFKKAESLVGWILGTGLPLVLSNMRDYIHGVKLDKEKLAEISDGEFLLDTGDNFLKCEETVTFVTGRLKGPIPFLAVPVKSRHDAVLGVLAVYWGNSNKAKFSSDRTQLHLGQSFASTISLALENKRQDELTVLLTQLGYSKTPDELFKVVINGIPKLISASECSIFMLQPGKNTSVLRLLYSSRVSSDSPPTPIEYKLGEGKTGFCGSARSILVINHFGDGKAAQKKLEREVNRIKEKYTNDLIETLTDEKENHIGFMQLWGGKTLSFPNRLHYKNLVQETQFGADGLPSKKMEQHHITKSRSFMAVPISREKKLLGVITIGRPSPRLPFSPDDVSLAQSIAGRLGSVMENLELQEQRKRLLISLAHEIHTPLTGILATAEALMNELPSGSELQEIAEHSLGQVLRLHLQTSTIMSVLSENSPQRMFSSHSIYRPLKDAAELFRVEAVQKGCDIKGPHTRGASFPVIEMSLFDLTIAFKNIVHNAIKYSFRPHKKLQTKRYIRILGEFDFDTPGYYLVKIQNYGVGITKEEIAKGLVFEPFYRGVKSSDRRRTGAGFGLAHAKQIIEEMHHGQILVESEHQGGDAYLTTFTVRLPLEQPE